MGRAFTVKAVHKDMYPATYNFKDDADGAEPTGWISNNGVDCTTTIIASLDGHRKVLQLYDNSAVARCDIYTTFTQGLNTVIEFWFTKSSVAANTTIILYLFEGATNCVQLRFEDNDLDYYSDNYYSLKDDFLVANILSHFKIILDDTANTFDCYIDGILEGTFAYRNNSVSGVNKINLISDNDDTGYSGYIADIGVSTDTDYKIGDNIHWRHYKESTDSFEGDDVGTQGTSITWVDSVDTAASVEIVPEFNEHKKILRQSFSSAAGGFDYSYHYFASQTKDGWCEFWIRVSDVTGDSRYELREGVTAIVGLIIDSSTIDYYDGNAAVYQTGPAAVNNTWYHIYIKWVDAANDTYDLWIDNILIASGVQTWNNQVSGINRFLTEQYDAADTCDLDAPISSLDSDERADNRVLEYNDTYTKTDITSTVLNIPDFRNRIYEWRTGTLISNTSYEFSEIFVEIYDINSVLTMRAELKSRKQNDAEYRYSLRDILWDDLHEPITHTFTTDDIHDPADSTTLLLTALPNVGQEDGDLILVEGDTKTTTYSPVLKSYPTYMFLRDIADLADCSIIITPEGKVYMDDDKASGDSLDVDTATDKAKMIALPVPTDILESINYFEIFGAINPDTGDRFYKIIDNSGTDKKRKWRYINNEFRNQTDVDNYATALSTRVTTVKMIRAGVQSLGGHNMGETFDYKYIKGSINIAQANYYIIEEIMNFDKNEATLTLNEGMIEGSKYSAGFEKPQNYADSYAGEIYETDINTILLEMWELGSTRSYFGMTTPQDQHVYSYFFCTDKVDTDRDITLTFSFYCDAAVTIDGLLDIFRYPSDGATAHTVVENDLNFDVTFGVGARFNDVVYTLDAADIVADTIFQIGYQNVDVTQVYVTQIQAQYYVKRSLS